MARPVATFSAETRRTGIAQIDSRGVDVRQNSSCGARLASEVTGEVTAHSSNNFPLRCVVGTSGNVMTLRGENK